MSRKLGQHFLHNKNALRAIVHALKLEKGDVIIEIGAGRGELTAPLLEACRDKECSVVAIEKDPLLADTLRAVYSKWSMVSRSETNSNLEIIEGDALKVLPDIIHHKPYAIRYKLVGNIPYYISGRLLRIISELESRPRLTILTLQSQVAERIAAKPPRMTLLAGIIGMWAEAAILRTLPPSDFSPPPEVTSAILQLTTRRKFLVPEKEIKKYYGFLKLIFKQPRKTIFNNLRDGFSISEEKIRGILKKNSLTGNERAQDLSLEMLITLASCF